MAGGVATLDPQTGQKGQHQYGADFYPQGQTLQPLAHGLFDGPIIQQKRHRKQAHSHADGQGDPHLGRGQRYQRSGREQGGVDLQPRRQQLLGEFGEHHRRRGDQQQGGTQAAMGFLNAEQQAGQGGAGGHRKAGAGTAGHGVAAPGVLLMLVVGGALTDGGTHLDGRALGAQRNAQQEVGQRQQKGADQAAQPAETEQAALGRNGGGDAASLQTGEVLIHQMEQPRHRRQQHQRHG